MRKMRARTTGVTTCRKTNRGRYVAAQALKYDDEYDGPTCALSRSAEWRGLTSRGDHRLFLTERKCRGTKTALARALPVRRTPAFKMAVAEYRLAREQTGEKRETDERREATALSWSSQSEKLAAGGGRETTAKRDRYV